MQCLLEEGFFSRLSFKYTENSCQMRTLTSESELGIDKYRPLAHSDDTKILQSRAKQRVGATKSFYGMKLQTQKEYNT